MGRKANKIEDVWKLVEKKSEDECWPWKGVIKRYGTYTVKGKMYRAHRVVYSLVHPGSISLRVQAPFSADSQIVLHSCDNPLCCNPKHLFLGKPKDNTQDMIRKGRRLDNVGVKNCHALFTEDEIRSIRKRYSKGTRVYILAKEHGANWQTMDDIVKGKSYRNINDWR